jgi:hypothetical protein
VVEEREDEPPEEDLSTGVRTDRKIDRLKRDIEGARIKPSSSESK